MAEKSNEIIKFLFNMKVVATITGIIDKDTAEYIVKEFGHKPVVEDKPSIELGKKNTEFQGGNLGHPLLLWVMLITVKLHCLTLLETPTLSQESMVVSHNILVLTKFKLEITN